MINQIISLAKVLQSNTNPSEIALGAVLGLFFGFTPSNQTHLILLVLLFFFLKINRATAMLVFPIAKLMYLVGAWSFADQIGYYLLTASPVPASIWSFVMNAPVLALLRWDHTLVIGGMAIALALSIPVYLAAIWGVHTYRATLAERVARWNVVKSLQSISLVKWFSDRWHQ
jgi:uncharacterized protein (TIGR03546 family)